MISDFNNITKEGYIIVQRNPTFVVDLNYESATKNWLLKEINNQFLPIRRLESWEIMQAEDQRDYGIILKADLSKYS